MSLLYGRAQSWTNHCRCVSPVLSIEEEPPASTCCQNSSWCSSGYCWSPVLQRHITGSYSPWCPTEPQSPLLQSCFSASQPPTQLMRGVIHLQMQDFAFTFVELHEVPVYFPSLLKFFWVGTHSSGLSSANLLRVYFVTSFRSLVKF